MYFPAEGMASPPLGQADGMSLPAGRQA